MDRVDEILLYVQKTNPKMTREKLIEELSKSEYAARSLMFGAMNNQTNIFSPNENLTF